jgi:hypothetical protein
MQDLITIVRKLARQAIGHQLPEKEIELAKKCTLISTPEKCVGYTMLDGFIYVTILRMKKEPNAERTGFIYESIFRSKEKYTMDGLLVEKSTDTAYGESIANHKLNYHSEKVYDPPGSWIGRKKKEKLCVS